MKKPGFRLKFGPATLVAAAFIGPGTVVTASLAGANFGYALLWALVFAVIATMILQEMAARIGVVTQAGLGEALRTVVQHPLLRNAFIALVVAAVVIGNSAYQGGNLTGASLGADALWGNAGWLVAFEERTGLNPWAFILGSLATLVLWQGKYKTIEKALIGLVVLMSLAFLTTFILTRPDFLALFRGLLLPSIPAGGALTMLALVGTTVVPYALFLHAAGARSRWPAETVNKDVALQEARADIVTSIPLGGLVSVAIVSTAAAAYFGHAATIEGAADLAVSLEPIFGRAATYLMAFGLLAAGLSSAITAPLASAYALVGVLGWRMDMKSRGFRLTWLSIILVGVTVASLGIRPISLILFAQVANGILLPLIAGFLLLAVNQTRLGAHRNNRQQNILGGIVFVVALLLGVRSIGLALF
ncbi:Nramp family divalent metal transporter [Aliidiomarina sanyensis]|uniref:Manganese transporter n=1 Tax=Aliidiomarina sanyensis TaxID=1249555 RepID=A0A432WB02_9GAMM|nr:Nramp family divalent metal transporter [Aliidiomarina sanyensis]RUO27961.1 manganese transporter [Aliidiomarina sanyensis]